MTEMAYFIGNFTRLAQGKDNLGQLVGMPEQVADVLLDYYDLGVTTFLIRGFDPVQDAIDYARDLIPPQTDRRKAPPRTGRLMSLLRAATLPSRSDPGAIDTARILSRLFAETAGAHDRSGKLPVENFRALGDAGLPSLTVPREAGGHGAGLSLAAEIVGITAQGEPSTALGTPARGGLPATIASQIDGQWSITGHKIYSTGIPVLGWLAVWGRTDEAESRIGTFLVPGPHGRCRDCAQLEPAWHAQFHCGHHAIAVNLSWPKSFELRKTSGPAVFVSLTKYLQSSETADRRFAGPDLLRQCRRRFERQATEIGQHVEIEQYLSKSRGSAI
jgi:hypothetical protein